MTPDPTWSDLCDPCPISSSFIRATTSRVALQSFPAGTTISAPAGPLPLIDEIPYGHKVSTRSIARGEPVRKYGEVIGFATADIPAGSHVHVHNLSAEGFERHGGTQRPHHDPARCRDHGRTADLRGLPARRRPGRDPQLRRDHQHRQLLGLHEPVHRERGRRPAGGLPERGRRRRADPQGRLRDAVRRPRPRAARARAGGVRGAPEHRGVPDGRARLRGRPDHAPPRQVRPRDAADPVAPDDDDPGPRRRPEDGGRRRGRAARVPARGERRRAGRAARLDAHARHAVRRFRRLQRHHRQPGAGRRRRPGRRPGRHGDPRRDARRSTAPSTSSSTGRSRPRSAMRCSSGSAGGRATHRPSARTSTTTRVPATRPAA